jgi:ABC-type multidrug transport system ATPase subunit
MNRPQVWILRNGTVSILLNEISNDVIVILSTHLVEDVRNLCSEVAIINKESFSQKEIQMN